MSRKNSFCCSSYWIYTVKYMNVLVVVCLTMYKSYYFMDITIVTWDGISLEVYCPCIYQLLVLLVSLH